MALRDYKCKSCGHIEERLELNNKPYGDMVCSKCDSKMERIISSSTFRLMGSGWFKPND